MSNVVSITSARDKQIAEQYFHDWLNYGQCAALLRIQADLSERQKNLIRNEFRKRGFFTECPY